jgi:mono/diheme cytochrome c family protein
LMPGFSKSAGGMLTDAQVGVIAQGMIDAWGTPSALAGATPLPYAAQGKGDAAHGQAAYQTFCASCHGADGTGVAGKMGSIVDPAYLALIGDQGLRSIVIAGRPDLGMPGAYGQQPEEKKMTDQEVTDVVAWLASQRTATPGQPYPQHP